MKSLRSKGYITGNPSTGRGQYLIRVVKYFEKKAHGDAPYYTEGAWGCALMPQKAHGDATYQEVKQEEYKYKKKPAQTRRDHSPEQIRQIEAKKRRIEKEEEVRKELYIGSGPVLADAIRKLAKSKSL